MLLHSGLSTVLRLWCGPPCVCVCRCRVAVTNCFQLFSLNHLSLSVWCVQVLFSLVPANRVPPIRVHTQWVLRHCFSLMSCRIVSSLSFIVFVPVRFYTNNSTSRAIIFRWNNSCGWLEILSHSAKNFAKDLFVLLVLNECKSFSLDFECSCFVSFLQMHRSCVVLFPFRIFFVSGFLSALFLFLFLSIFASVFVSAARTLCRNFHAYGFSIERQ